MTFLLLLSIIISVIQSNFAEECSQILFTNYPPRHINYTGDACMWTVIAPESQRIVLTLQRFGVQNHDQACTVYLNVYDEVSAARPICPDFVGSNEYISDGNAVYLNVTNVSGEPVRTFVEATFRPAEEYLSCGFNSADNCTSQVAHLSSWSHSANGNDVCTGLSTSQRSQTGLFYQSGFSSDDLRLPSLPPGKYVFEAEIIATCSTRDLRQLILLTFCNITRSYSLQVFYYNWSRFFEVIECNIEFEVTMYASPGSMLIAMDSFRLMKVTDEIHIESTVPTSTTYSLITTGYITDPSGFRQRKIMMCVSSAIIFLVVVFGVGCVFFLKRTRKVNEMPEGQIRVTFNNSTYDNSKSQEPATVVPHQYDTVRNNGNSMISESEYQAVNGAPSTEAYHYIHDVTHLGYESMLPGVQGKDLNHPVSLGNGKKLQEEDDTYYMSTGNEYQVMNQPASPNIYEQST